MDMGLLTQTLQQSFYALVILIAPPAVVALVTGLIVTIAEAATGVQDATVTFVCKVAAVGLTYLVIGEWQMHYLLTYTRSIFALLSGVGPS